MKPLTRPGFVIWLTGLPASGKTSLAIALQKRLAQLGIHAVVLDSDEMRAILTPQPTYSDAERCWFYNVLVHWAAWLANNGINVLIAATGNRRIYRHQAREQIERFAEIYVKCPLDVCQRRDPKGIYARAYDGDADTVPGIGAIYEAPFDPEVTIDTSQGFPTTAADSVILQLQLKKIIGGTTDDDPHPLKARRALSSL